MLELKHITKIYQSDDIRVKALDDLSLKFRENEFVSILGPSGCGKTTLLNIVGGLDGYTEGDLIINSKSTKEFKDRDWDTYRNHSVGFVFQNYNLIPHQTVLSNVELALTLAGMPKKERREKAIKALEAVGLKDQINKKPNQMSGGQMQRVAIARALVSDPDILLADEPTGALDTKTSVQIMELLKDIAKDRLVIMVTHNPDIANEYSTRIIKLLDGKVIDDSNPFKGKDKENKKINLKKTFMSFKTALSLSLNNLMTKKGRTLLTSFAGSIGIIGIALIMSLSNGIQEYIDRIEQETLSSYPLSIQKESVDMTSFITSLTNNAKEVQEERDDSKIYTVSIMEDMMKTVTQDVKKNDLKAFKEYIEDNKEELSKYVSTIEYGYNVTMNIYKADTSEEIVRVNPTTTLSAIGMDTSGLSNVYSSYMSNYDVFYEMLDNEELLHEQYQVVNGRWPNKFNEVVLLVGPNNEISDYTLYSLGVFSQKDLKEQFTNMISGKDVEFTSQELFDPKELVGLKYKLLLNTDFYKKTNGIWVNMSKDEDYMKKAIKKAQTIEIVGIIKAKEGAIVNTAGYGMVGYTHELMEHLIEQINKTTIVKEQKKNKKINVFTGNEFSKGGEFSYENLTPEQMQAFASMSKEELSSFIATYQENANASYETNLNKLGIRSLDDPDSISIYPIDFESKENVEEFINKYNEGKEEKDQITYTDIVGVMMSSVSTIVNVISKVLIAFVAISLIVSSIMIGIITYISVLERTKEIGILRSIGASKKDIRRVFNAETFIVGLAAGVMGIIITILLNIPINIIVYNLTDVENIAVLPIIGAIALIIISMLLTVFAGLMPSNYAAKKDPVIALRTE